MPCCGYTLTDFPISIRLISLALWQSNDFPSASKATLMNMDKYFMWIHYERLRNHNKAKHNETVCIFLGIYCTLCLSKFSYTVTHTLCAKRIHTSNHTYPGPFSLDKKSPWPLFLSISTCYLKYLIYWTPTPRGQGKIITVYFFFINVIYISRSSETHEADFITIGLWRSRIIFKYEIVFN